MQSILEQATKEHCPSSNVSDSIISTQSGLASAPSHPRPGYHLATFLEPYKHQLERLYQWGVPAEIVATRKLQGNSFQKTSVLKAQLQQELAALSQRDDIRPLAIAREWIRQWGGIKLKDSGLTKILQAFPNHQVVRSTRLRFPFEGIASWSKWLALTNNWAAIYDARVAYSINAIHYLCTADRKILPIPPGRNETMRMMDSSTLALSAALARRPESVSMSAKQIRTALFVPKPQAYSTYLEWIADAHAQLWADAPLTPLSHTEMLLFAMADNQIFDQLKARFAIPAPVRDTA